MKYLVQKTDHDKKNIDRNIWIQLGTGNNVRNIDLSAGFNELGLDMCNAFTASHAFIGSDFTPSSAEEAKLHFKKLSVK